MNVPFHTAEGGFDPRVSLPASTLLVKARFAIPVFVPHTTLWAVPAQQLLTEEVTHEQSQSLYAD